MSPVQSAWEALSNSMRLYAESSFNFNLLFAVDAEEAICNHDRAFDAKLEAFHRLYDVTKKLPAFDYFGHGDTSLLIVLRNALHHRDHSLFKSWHSMMHGDGGVKEKAGALYLLASYGGLTDATSKYSLPLHDFYARLSHSSAKHPSVQRVLWDKDLSFDVIAAKGANERYPERQVYVDVIPVFISAMQRVARWLQSERIGPTGFDGEVYFEHFLKMDAVELTAPSFTPSVDPQTA